MTKPPEYWEGMQAALDLMECRAAMHRDTYGSRAIATAVHEARKEVESARALDNQ